MTRAPWPLLATLALATSVVAAPVAGQDLALSVHSGATRMMGNWSATVGGDVLLAVHPGVRVGGTATVLLKTALGGELSTGEPGELEMAYGGVVVDVDLPTPWLSARLLVGGGHVTLTDPVVGTRAAADSFVVLEPGLRASLPLWRRLSAAVTVGYRWVDGTGGLPGLDPERLRAPVVGLGLTLVP